jgi:hypothetical protein
MLHTQRSRKGNFITPTKSVLEHGLFDLLFLSFYPLRQKERFGPEAHLHGDVQFDLDFAAGHPVLLFGGRFI